MYAVSSCPGTVAGSGGNLSSYETVGSPGAQLAARKATRVIGQFARSICLNSNSWFLRPASTTMVPITSDGFYAGMVWSRLVADVPDRRSRSHARGPFFRVSTSPSHYPEPKHPARYLPIAARLPWCVNRSSYFAPTPNQISNGYPDRPSVASSLPRSEKTRSPTVLAHSNR